MYGPGVLLADRYLLELRIGSGGMGEVWRATDQVLNRTVAVKVMRPQFVAQPGFAQRFLAEARAMATIKHPAVVDIYDYQGDSSSAFLVMELVEGEPLSHRLRQAGRMDSAFTTALVAQTAEALQAAHDKGIVHRDVKPANLLVTPDGRIVLTDFGIARSGSSAQLTATGEVIGTPSYLAPEQVLGHRATPQSDMYALGVVAYECLTGRPPFDGDNSFAIATQRLHEPPPPMDADVPADVAALVRRMLATEPDQRWPSAYELARAARTATTTLLDAETVTANPDAVATRLLATVPPPPPHPHPPPPPSPPSGQPTAQTTPAQPTAATVRAQPETQPTAAAHHHTPVQPPPTRPLEPEQPSQRPRRRPAAEAPASEPAPPAKPAKPRRPRSLVVAGVLLAVAAGCLAVYVAILSSVRSDTVTVAERRLADSFAWLADAVPVASWAVIAVYGFLAFMLLLSAAPLALGSRVARGWAFTFGLTTLLVAAPLGVAAAFLVERLDPDSEVLRELVAAIPSSYPPYIIAAGITSMLAVLVALILLMTRQARAYAAGRS
ncbi:serine/threonine-protein kinase [Phytoactinopolyspora alkaliphila]|uniref:serine/threonine-protein kinase n=1 Tax=Phytoactinopolyspora alkaliphila TaxID=1783498 RepID=UPI001C206838|nr:serine/threonine-protein kinase [Phytoactinopolyspora alkaliphila]